MTLGSRVLAAMFASTSLLLPLGAVAASGVPQSGTLPHGGTYTIYADPTIAATAVDLWFRAPSDGYAHDTPGVARLAATAAAASKLESGKSLVEFVHSVGGRIAISVYPDLVSVSTIVPATAARRAIAALTSAYFAPSIDENALKTAQRDAAVLAVQQRYSSDAILHNAIFAQLFAGSPGHATPLPDTVPELTRPSLAQITSFAKRAFRSANGMLTVAGNTEAAAIDAVTAGSSGSADAPIDSRRDANPQDATVPANVGGVGLGWIGPAITDERAATALDFVADYLFREETGVVSKALGITDDTYAQGQFITLHDPGVMLVTIGGTKTDAAQKQVLDAIAKLEQPLDPATFAAAREAFLYHLASDTVHPGEIADTFGWYAMEGNSAYAPGAPNGAYWQTARALDPAYVAKIVKQYLARPIVVKLLASSKESSS